MNYIVYLSSDEEDDKRADYSVLFDGVLETSDEKPKSNSSLDPTVEDDDCVVLDGDPYKSMAKDNAVDTYETDEVVVVGQKGEIACRDFPHPRHACAKYPFNSTSHQNYCEMCHCYVCDIRAPCAYWFMGFSDVDHCHANDKDEMWKNQRKFTRTGTILPQPPSTIAKQTINNYHLESQSIQSFQNNWYSPAPQYGFRACPTATMVSTHPNTYMRPGYRTEQPSTFPQNPGLQPRSVQLLPNHRDISYTGYPSPQVVSSNPYSWTRPLSGGSYLPEVSMHNVSHAPPDALQSNPRQIVNGYIPTVPESHSKVYAREFNRNMYSANVQTSAVPSETPNPRTNQQQNRKSGKSNDKVLSELEDWLMDTSTPTGAGCPLSGQDNVDIRREGERERDPMRGREGTGREIRHERERERSHVRDKERTEERERGRARREIRRKEEREIPPSEGERERESNLSRERVVET